MSRNVVRSIRRPCVKAQWHSQPIQHSIRRWYSSTEQTQSPEEITSNLPLIHDREQTLQLLRNLDQKHLSACRRGTDDILRLIPQARDEVAKIPIAVQTLPEIPPYTLDRLRVLSRSTIPTLAEETVTAAKDVREHLIDLQYKPYEDGDKNGRTAFEREVAAMTEEEKARRYSEVQLLAEGQRIRLQKRVKDVVAKTLDTIARHSRPKGGGKDMVLKFGKARSDEVEEDEYAHVDVVDIATESKVRMEGWAPMSRPDVVERTEREDENVSTMSILSPSDLWESDSSHSQIEESVETAASKTPELKIRKYESDSSHGQIEESGDTVASKIPEFKIRKGAHVQETAAHASSNTKEQTAKAEEKRTSFEDLKQSLSSTVSKDKE